MNYVNPLTMAGAFTLAGVVCLVVCLADANGNDAFLAEPSTITMKSLSFAPKKLEINVGDSVVWTNDSRTSHTAISDDDGKTFDTGDVPPGESSKSVKFETEGEFKYHCKVHGKSMSGTIVVKAAEKK